ncbi:bifunctional 3-phenylpropionate/cinnamic acid dioxygenase ferredoxin subunit [Luteococcus sediminum]|uniref:bifunctional 3-phenylpropionate/cinnamic acid dioxygenase ferredoxin subunit n=1 Tax=Luteococcus sp. TaxID=1969402 RepID=UPI00373571C5
MPEAIKVAAVGEIEDESAIVVDGATNGTGEDIAVFFSDGTYYAIDDTCTHQDASLAEGWVEGDEVECPVHAARFSLCTGAALCLPATVAVKTHKVELRGDEVWLHPGVPADKQ